MASLVVLSLSILLQFTAAGLAIRLIRITGRRLAWSLIAAAMLFMGVRRCLTFFHALSGEVALAPNLPAELVAFTISALMVLGVAWIAPLFMDIQKTQEARRESERRLAQANRTLQLVLDTIPARVFWKDRDLNYLGCNRLFAKDAGFDDPEELIGRDDFAMGWRNEAELYRADDRQVIESLEPRLSYEEPQTTPEGERMWLRTSKIPLQDANGDVIGILGTYENISERKLTDEALHKTNRALKVLGECNEALILATDERKLLEEICRIIVDSGGYRLAWVGYAEHDEGKTVRPAARWGYGEGYVEAAAITWADEPRGRGPAGTAIRTGAPCIARNIQSDPDFGPWRKDALERGYASSIALPLRAGGSSFGGLMIYAPEPEAFDDEEIRLLANLTDNMAYGIMALKGHAERERAEGALMESEARKRNILESALDGIITIDEKGMVLEFNPSAEDMFGYRGEEVRGKEFVDLIIPPDLRKKHCRGIKRHLKTGKSTILGKRLEKTALRANGEEFPVELTVTSHQMEGQRFFTAFLRDISGHKRTEEALRRSQKMEAVGQLTGGIAHDFNNLLGIIIGNLDFLKRQLDSDPGPLRRVETTLKAALRGADLTSRLLAFSRQQPQAPNAADINELVEGMNDILARSLTQRIEVETRLAEGLWLTVIDPGDLEDTILNLAINARDAMPMGGRLVIETSNANLDADYASREPDAAPGNYVLLTVSDTGEGMPKEMIEKAFDPFFTTKPRDKGTGLGLSMVYGFVKRSRGHIKIYSELGQGTAVRIYLPRAAGTSKRKEAAEGTADVLPRGGETILVVDDESDLLDVAENYLVELGYRTIGADNSREALKILASGRKIDLLFSDVVMPGGMNGYDLARRAIERRPGLKILLASGFTQKMAQGSEMNTLPVSLLTKPYQKTDLAQRVRRVLDDTG